MFLLVDMILAGSGVKYQRTGLCLSFSRREKKQLCFHIWPCYSALYIFVCLSWRTGANQQQFICHSNRKSDFSWSGLPPVHLCGWLPSLPNFTPAPVPHRCSRRSRGNTVFLVGSSSGWEWRGSHRKGECYHPNVAATWRSEGFQKPGASHTCMCSFHLA